MKKLLLLAAVVGAAYGVMRWKRASDDESAQVYARAAFFALKLR
jgi:hypothetical protein